MNQYLKLLPAALLVMSMYAQAATFTVTFPEVVGEYNDASFPGPEEALPIISFADQIPHGEVIVSAVAEGAFGSSLSTSSAPVRVFINGVNVAECGRAAACETAAEPTPWRYTFSKSELNSLSANEATLSYIQTWQFMVILSETTLTLTTAPSAVNVTPTPVPTLGTFGLMGLASAVGAAGIAMNRRRKQ